MKKNKEQFKSARFPKELIERMNALDTPSGIIERAERKYIKLYLYSSAPKLCYTIARGDKYSVSYRSTEYRQGVLSGLTENVSELTIKIVAWYLDDQEAKLAKYKPVKLDEEVYKEIEHLQNCYSHKVQTEREVVKKAKEFSNNSEFCESNLSFQE